VNGIDKSLLIPLLSFVERWLLQFVLFCHLRFNTLQVREEWHPNPSGGRLVEALNIALEGSDGSLESIDCIGSLDWLVASWQICFT
jgi:hypothetical protein